MFTWIGKQGVRSSDGFEVQSIDRFSIAYREGSQVVTVFAEAGSYGRGPSICIQRNAFAHWDSLRIANSPEKQAQMRQNFVAAMKFQGITVEP